MRKTLLTLALLAAPAALMPAADPGVVRVIGLEDLARTLPPDPITVVFDVDDTALFTSPGFQLGSRPYGENIVAAGVSIREEDLPTEEQRRKYRELWTRMNNDLDRYSVKKWGSVAESVGRFCGQGAQS